MPAQEAADITRQEISPKTVLITGGAGFIGINLADRLLAAGENVLIYDNISRPGVEQNLYWLMERHGEDRVQVEIADIRALYQLRKAAAGAKMVFHFAAQVAVTTSVADPVRDFETNLTAP
jgi:CDP-paratose 2-epimerase